MSSQSLVIDAGLMLAQRRRRWPNISPALGEHLVSDDHIEHDAPLYSVKSEPTASFPALTFMFQENKCFLSVQS